MLPLDPTEHLEALRKAYEAGDTLALLQAVRYAQAGAAVLPKWAIAPAYEVLAGIMTKSEKGSKGKGNAAFGRIRKDFVRAVRASAYHYVRAWQRDPHRYVDMPRATILHWYNDTEVNLWLSWRSYSDAARLAGIGLAETVYKGTATTVRKAAFGLPPPQQFGRRELEEELGLRGPNGIFGPPPGEPPKHVKMILSKHAADT